MRINKQIKLGLLCLATNDDTGEQFCLVLIEKDNKPHLLVYKAVTKAEQLAAGLNSKELAEQAMNAFVNYSKGTIEAF